MEPNAVAPDELTDDEDTLSDEDLIELWNRADEMLAEAIAHYKVVNASPSARCRALSLAITHAETALLWSAHYDDDEAA